MTARARVPRVGIIGISGYGRIHLELARECQARGEIEIAAAVVINPGEEASNVEAIKASGGRIYPDYSEMMKAEAGKVDLCMIPTGIPWHCRMTVAALESGMNVLVEKPLAGALDDAESVIRAEKSSGRFAAVGFQDIYEPSTQELQAQLVEGLVGRVKSVRFLGLWPRSPSYFNRNDWAGRLYADGIPVLDSPLNNAFAHFVNLGLFFASPNRGDMAEAKQIRAVLFRANKIESFDTAVVSAVTDEGVRLWFGATHTCASVHEPEIVIEGEDGRVIWRHENECIVEYRGRAVERRALRSTVDVRRAMMHSVLQRLQGAEAPICSASMALKHTALITRIHRTTPIVTIPAEAQGLVAPASGGEPVICVKNLEEVLCRSFDRFELPPKTFTV